MTTLCQDNIFEMRKYLDDIDYCNSLLVCKLWSSNSIKETRRRIGSKISPIVLHGFRRNRMKILKYLSTARLSKHNEPYLGICLYNNKKYIFYCEYIFNIMLQEASFYLKEPIEEFKMFFPLNCEIDNDVDYDSPMVEHYLKIRYKDDIIVVKKHKENGKYLIGVDQKPYFSILDTDDAYINYIEQRINNKEYPEEEIWKIPVLAKVFFEECKSYKSYNFNTFSLSS